ncbi:hypothetical protein BJV82DRAFT_6872 [Fennellomyces sp. T-0311]|nr:hypothetical protein BJV82DRAFT_6872 [Fennellomyces sp. T-0311]
MDQIPVYDTSSGQWNTEATKGPTPSPRFSHSATTKPDTGEIIVFGGMSPVDASFIEDYFYILDTETMTWRNTTIGAEDGANVAVTMISDHSAVLVESILYILFGQLPDYSYSSDVRPLDTNSWSWVSSVPAVKDSGTSGSGTSTGTIVGATVGSVGGVAVIGVVVLFFCWRKRRQSKKQENNDIPLDTSGEKHEVENPMGPPLMKAQHYSQAHPGPQSPNSLGMDMAHRRQDAPYYYHGPQKPDVDSSVTQQQMPVQNNPDTRH